MTPIIQPPAPNLSAYRGNSGSTMPNPIRSIKTVRKMTSSDGLRFIFSTNRKFTDGHQKEQ